MADASQNQPDYRKISRRAGGSFSHYQLWRCDDHLLFVKEAGCVHEYRRFYFSDIQAVIISRSPAYILWALVLPVVMIFMLGAWINADDKVFPSGLMMLTALLLIIHLVRGPTCRCWIQTGINKQRLPMFNRLRAAEKFVRRIQPDIDAVQGVFSLEAMEQEGTRPDPTVIPKPKPPPLPLEPDVEPGRL